MKNLFKKLLSCCLVVCMVLTLCVGAITASAEEVAYDGTLEIGKAEIEIGATEAEVPFTATATGSGIAAAEVNVTLPEGCTSVSKLELDTTDENVEVTFATVNGEDGLYPLDVLVDTYGPESEDYADYGAIVVTDNVFSYIITTNGASTNVAITLKITFAGAFDSAKEIPLTATVEACKDAIDLINLEKTGDAKIVVKEAHTHAYVEVVTDPTCTEQGYTTYTCSCDDSYVDNYVDALGHNWVDGEITYDNCTDAGNMVQDCSRCDATQEVAVDPKGHTAVPNVDVPATCTTTGLQGGTHCDDCDAVIEAATEVPALGHNFTYTDLEDGNHSVDCSRCDDADVASEAHVDEDTNDACDKCNASLAPAEIVVDETIAFKDFKVSIGACLEMKIRVTKNTIDKEKYKYYDLVVVPTKYDRTSGNAYNEIVLEPIVLADDPTENYSVYKYTDIAMYELGLTMDVYVRCYDANDRIIATSKVETVSAEQKLMEEYVKTNATEKLKNVVADLLNMGAKAQIFFGYRNKSSKLYADLIDPNKNILVNKGINESDLTESYGELSDEISADWNPESSITSDTNRLKTSLSADKAPIPTFEIYKGTSLNRSDIKLRVVYTSNKGTEYDFEVSGENLRVSGTKLIYNCDVLAYYDTNVNVSVTFTYAGTRVWTQQYSVETGVKGNLGSSDANLVGLVDAIAKFGVSARRYTGYGVNQ